MNAKLTAFGEGRIANFARDHAKRHIASDAVWDWERRRHLFEPCWPHESREIAARYQLDVVLGVAHARNWAARWREGAFRGPKRRVAAWTASGSTA